MPKSEALDALLAMLLPAMENARQRRKSIEQEWLLNYRSWQGWPSQSYQLPLPDGAIHYFIPHARRAIEKNVKRATKLLMPNADWHQTLPFDNRSHENAEAVHNTLRYIYQKKLPTKRNISAGMRCLQLYNLAVQHTSVRIDGDEVWPDQKIVDPFCFYIFPDTAASPDDALLIFEDTIVPYQVYKSFVNDEEELSLYDNIDVKELTKPIWPYHLIERLAYRGLTEPDTTSANALAHVTPERITTALNKTADLLSQQSKAFVSLTKVYFRLANYWYYAVICMNMKDGGVAGQNARIVRLDNTENKPLYRWTSTRPLPGEQYTNSPADDIRVLQNLTNTAISQVESNRSIFAEPDLAADSNGIARMEQKTFGNRRIWYFDGNPKDILMPLNVQDTSTNGFRAWQSYMGLIDQNTGGTITQGQPGRNMPRAGGVQQNIMNMALVDVEDDADTFEQAVLTPGLADVYHVILEYIPDSQLIKIPNKNPRLIKAYKKKDITGDYSFTWLGSLGFQSSQERADKFNQFMTTLFNPQILQLILEQLKPQKMTIDFVNILKTWYSFGLGERNLGDIIIPMSSDQLQALQQLSPDQQKAQQEQQQAQLDQQGQQAQAQADLQSKQAEGALQHQQGQIDLQKGQLDLQRKGLDIKAKQMDTVLTALNSNGSRK